MAEQQVCVITGGSSGIGSEMAVYFSSLGWAVAFTYVGNEVGAEETAAAIRKSGGKVFYDRCDVGYSEQVDQFLAATVAALGLPKLWVNNAGVQTWAPFLELDEESWDRTIRTNLKGTFLCTQKFARALVEAKSAGCVVNVGSGCNKHPFPRLVDYSASKGGIEMLTRVAATELGEYGIRVNCVAPGAIEIERTRLEAPEYAETWAAQAPLGRVGNPQDVAAAIAYFASDAASFVTGQTVYVDGGAFTAPNWPAGAYD
jgi:NAD(P)-dependent dehydrogenase (short-subunit alcohol dehydrogenase family)